MKYIHGFPAGPSGPRWVVVVIDDEGFSALEERKWIWEYGDGSFGWGDTASRDQKLQLSLALCHWFTGDEWLAIALHEQFCWDIVGELNSGESISIHPEVFWAWFVALTTPMVLEGRWPVGARKGTVPHVK